MTKSNLSDTFLYVLFAFLFLSFGQFIAGASINWLINSGISIIVGTIAIIFS